MWDEPYSYRTNPGKIIGLCWVIQVVKDTLRNLLLILQAVFVRVSWEVSLVLSW